MEPRTAQEVRDLARKTYRRTLANWHSPPPPPRIRKFRDYTPTPQPPDGFIPEVIVVRNQPWPEGLWPDTPPVRKVTVEKIIRATAEHYKISVHDILSRRRAPSIARPRQVAYYLAREKTLKSLPEIGRLVSGRDHTTVLHGISVTEERMRADSYFCQTVAELEQTL